MKHRFQSSAITQRLLPPVATMYDVFQEKVVMAVHEKAIDTFAESRMNSEKNWRDLLISVERELAISTTIGMEGIPLISREAVVATIPSLVERQATVVEESSVIIFVIDGQSIIKPPMLK